MQKIEKLDTKRAFKYYCMGLNSKEIAKLMDCSYRTVQNYMSAESWKQQKRHVFGKISAKR